MRNLILAFSAATSMNAFAFQCKAGSYLCRRYLSLPDVGINSVCITTARRSVLAISDEGGATEFRFDHKPHWRGCAGVIGFWNCDHQLVEPTNKGFKAMRRSVINKVHSEAAFELNLATGEATWTYQNRDTEAASLRSYVCERLYADYLEHQNAHTCNQSLQ